MRDPEARTKDVSTLPGNRVAAQLAGSYAMKKAHASARTRMMPWRSKQLREARAMREIRLLTETSTQIRISADAESSPFRPFEGEQRIITGTLNFGKCFYHSALGEFRKATVRSRPDADAVRVPAALLCYDG